MKQRNRILSLMLALLLVVGMLPISTITAFAADTHKHCLCGGNTNIGDHTTHTSNQEWQPTDTLPTTAGYYYLTSDITLTEQWKPADGTYLCLNGKVIRQTAENQSVIVVETNRTFTLTNCGTDGHKFSVGDDGVWQLDTDGENLLTGGVITGADGNTGIFAIGEIYIYNCNIVGNKSVSGGGLQCRNAGKFYNVNIIGNFTERYGGGISSSYCNIEIYGGKIAHNIAQLTGGGVDSQFGNLLIQGTEISQNTATANGGGVWSSANTTINISGNTIIEGNTGNNKRNNLYLAGYGTNSAKIAVGTMGTSASIGISADDNQTETISAGGKDYADNFFSDSGAYIVAADGDNLKFVEKTVQVGMVTLGNGEYTTNGTNETAGEPTGTGYAYFKDGVLTLNNFTYSGGGENHSAIYCSHALTIKIEGENSITRIVTSADTNKAVALRGIRVENGKLEMIGDSRDHFLKVVVNGHDNVSASGIYGDYEGIDIKDCTLEARSVNGGKGLNAPGNITITGAKVIGASEVPATNLNNQGIYAGVLKVTNSDVAGIADNTSPGRATGIYLDASKAKLVFESGTIVGKVPAALGDSYAIYLHTNNATLPAKYWMRRAASGEYMDGTWEGANVGPYIELTTAQIQNEWVSTPTIQGWIYDQAKGTPQAEAKYGTVEFKYYDENKAPIAGIPDNAGTYYLKGFVAETENYTGLESNYVEFKIEQRMVDIVWKEPSNLVYDGTAKIPSAVGGGGLIGDDDPEIYIELTAGCDNVNVGSFTFTATGIADPNYKIGGNAISPVYTILKEEQIVPHTPTGVNTTYIDTADGKITGVDETMEYRKEGDANYSAVTGTEITGLAAGKYYVRYAEKANYNPSPDNVITISEGPKRTATITDISDIGKTYDGTVVVNPDYTYDGNGTMAIKWYADNDGIKGDALAEAPRNAGTYWVGVSASASANYNATPEVTKQFKIAQADYPVAWLQNLVGNHGETLSTVPLTGGFTWDNPNEIIKYGNGHKYAATYTPKDTVNYKVAHGFITVNGADVTAPTGTVAIGEKSWNALWNDITFGLFFKEPQTVTVTAVDDESGITATEYYLANEKTDDFTNVQWTAFDGSFDINPNNKYVVYIRITNGAGYKTIINSDGVVLDSIAPVISGIENSKDVYGDATFTVDEDNLDTVTVDGNNVDAVDGKYTITADNKEHTVIVTDQSGNSIEYKLTVYKNYTVTFVADGKEITKQVVGHGKDAELPEIPAKDGYTAKWYADGKNITADTTITAEYTEIPKTDSPQTGDNKNMTLWIALLFISGLGIVAITALSRKKRTN